MFSKLLFLTLILLSSVLFPVNIHANSFDYFSPVDVGSNPQREAPSQVNDPENKDASVYSNNIDQSPITCTYQNDVSEDKEPKFDLINQIKNYLLTPIDSLTEIKTNTTFTNQVFRDSHLQFAKDPIIKLKGDPKEQSDNFKSFDENSRNTNIRAQPYQYQLYNKGRYIEEALISLSKTQNTIATDEIIAWNCNGTCQNLFDQNGQKPSNCQPITISEIGYYFYNQNTSTTYKIENNKAINIPFSTLALDVLNNYSHFRPQFKLPADDSCYQNLYQNLPLTPRGTVNTKYVFHNFESGSEKLTDADRALPLAASLASKQTETTLDLIIPYKQTNSSNYSSLCQQFEPNTPINDKPSPLSITAYFKAFVKNIINPETVSHDLTTDLVLPSELVNNLKKDNQFIDNLIPEKSQVTQKLDQIKLASTDSTSNANLPDVGYQDSLKRQFLTKSIIPVSWQKSQSVPNSGATTTPPPGVTSGTLSNQVHNWCPLITKYATNQISAAIIASIIQTESQGNSQAYSSQGAVGLMQIMPSDGTAADIYPGTFKDRPTMAELFNPETNISFGVKLLQQNLSAYADLRTALLHYGPTDVGYSYADNIINLASQNQNFCQ